MSFKAHKGCHPEGQPAGQAESSFASLPEAVVARVAQLSKQSRCHPFLRVSRSCRDAALSSCTTIRLCPSELGQQASEAVSLAPSARLLHRACCQAAPGLKLRLYLQGHRDSLPYLLQPGLEYGGWRNVRKLVVGSELEKSKLYAAL
jgi:hypothetical protein